MSIYKLWRNCPLFDIWFDFLYFFYKLMEQSTVVILVLNHFYSNISNSKDPDQRDPIGTLWSEYNLFCLNKLHGCSSSPVYCVERVINVFLSKDTESVLLKAFFVRAPTSQTFDLPVLFPKQIKIFIHYEKSMKHSIGQIWKVQFSGCTHQNWVQWPWCVHIHSNGMRFMWLFCC